MADKIVRIILAAVLCVIIGSLPPAQAAAAAIPAADTVHIQSTDKTTLSRSDAVHIQSTGKTMPSESDTAHIESSGRTMHPESGTAHIESSERTMQLESDTAHKESADKTMQPESDPARIQAANNMILQAPDKLEAAKIAYNAVTLSWSEVSKAVGYQIEYSLDGDDYRVVGKTAADVRTYKCKKLITGTEYKFRVCALDQSNKAGNYASVVAQPRLKKPKITNTSVVQLRAINIEWKKVSGAQTYELYRKVKEGEDYQLLTSTEGLSYTDETILSGQVYLYRLRAVRKVNEKPVYSKYSAAVEMAAEMPVIQLEACEAVNAGSVKLTWQQSAAVTGYYIYRSVKEDGTYKKIKTIQQNTTTSYTDTGVVPGKAFYYKICGYIQEADQPAVSGTQSGSMMAETQMQAPNLTAVKSNIENRTLMLSWEKMTEATGFRVFRSIYPNKKFVKIADVEGGIAVGYEDRSAAPGGTYYYRIRALYENKKYTGKSPTSNIQQGNAAPGAPIGLNIRQTSSDTLKIAWNKTAGASGYNLYRSDTAAGTYTCIAQGIAVTEYTDTQLYDDKTYYYKVSAVGAGGEGRKCFAVSCLMGGVSLNTRTLKLCVGASKQLKLSTYRKGSVVWKSADAKIAEVNSEGIVTGVAYGTVEITATVAGRSAAVTVTVTPGTKNGIDVSRWQEEVDWCRVQESGVDFAFLRISNHYLEDFTFETKYQDAASVGMPLGVYCYSRAVTVAEAEEEARTVLQILNGRKLDYPIALDMEDAVHKSDSMTKDTLHQMILGFKKVVEDAGYRFVLYSYLSFFDTNLDKTRLDGIDLWIARYRSLLLGTGYTGTGNEKYWQYNSGQYSGSDFHVDGITDAAGNLVEVDVNVEY